MNINSINSYNSLPQQNTNFKATLINTSKMSLSQKILAKNLHSKIEYSEIYHNLHKKGIDIVMLPAKKQGSIFVKFVERLSDNFLRRDNKQIKYQVNDVSDYVEHSNVDKFIKFMEDVEKDGYVVKDSFKETILANKTDLAKIYDGLYKDAEYPQMSALEIKGENDANISWRKYNLDFDEMVKVF